MQHRGININKTSWTWKSNKLVPSVINLPRKTRQSLPCTPKKSYYFASASESPSQRTVKTVEILQISTNICTHSEGVLKMNKWKRQFLMHRFSCQHQPTIQRPPSIPSFSNIKYKKEASTIKTSPWTSTAVYYFQSTLPHFKANEKWQREIKPREG